MIKLTIPGRPVPAVRMTQRGKFVDRAAKRYMQYKDVVGFYAKVKCKEPIKGPVKVCIRAYVGDGRPGDLDNIIKSILDGLNKIAWVDDRQVVRIEAERLKDKNERAEVRIWEI